MLIKWKIIAIAGILGWSPSSPRTTENKKIAEVAINLVCYENGIAPVGYRTFCKWTDAIDESLHGIKTNLGTDLLERKKRTNTKYHILIEKEGPGYILSMFRKAQRVLGVEATFVELAETMNWLSLKENDKKPELKFTCNTLFSLFHSVNGTIKKRISKPILDDKRKEERVKWCQEMQNLYKSGEKNKVPIIITYLDEKNFYTSSGRKKAKYVPKGKYKNKEKMPAFMAVGYCHPPKTIYVGIVGTTIEGKFDGNIMLKRVSETKKI